MIVLANNVSGTGKKRLIYKMRFETVKKNNPKVRTMINQQKCESSVVNGTGNKRNREKTWL